MFRTFLLLLACSSAMAQPQPDGQPKGPPPPPPSFGPGKGDPRGMFSNKMRHYGGGFEKLSEEDKAKVRRALDAAWQKPEVQAARDRLMKANDDFRDVIRTTLQGIDPAVVTILDKIRPDTPMLASEPWPKPEAENFADLSIARMGKELSMFARPDRRDAMLQLHMKLLEQPEVKPLVEAVRAAPVAERVSAFKKLHSIYREQAQKAIESYMKERREAGKDGWREGREGGAKDGKPDALPAAAGASKEPHEK
jgi:hypothetical protein